MFNGGSTEGLSLCFFFCSWSGERQQHLQSSVEPGGKTTTVEENRQDEIREEEGRQKHRKGFQQILYVRDIFTQNPPRRLQVLEYYIQASAM